MTGDQRSVAALTNLKKRKVSLLDDDNVDEVEVMDLDFEAEGSLVGPAEHEALLIRGIRKHFDEDGAKILLHARSQLMQARRSRLWMVCGCGLGTASVLVRFLLHSD